MMEFAVFIKDKPFFYNFLEGEGTHEKDQGRIGILA